MAHTLELGFMLKVWGLGEFPVIRIDEQRFLALKQANEILQEAISIETKYKLITSNYSNINSIGTKNLLEESDVYTSFHDVIFDYNLKLSCFLTCVKGYQDLVKRHVKKCIPEKSGKSISHLVRKLFNEQHSNSFEYKFMYELRNYVQHYSLPVDSMTLSMNGAHTPKIFFNKKNDGYDGFEDSKWEDMPDKVNLIEYLSIYMSSITDIQCKIRELILENVESSSNLLLGAINEYKAVNNGETTGLCLIHAKSSNELEKIHLSMRLDDMRVSLIEESKKQLN